MYEAPDSGSARVDLVFGPEGDCCEQPQALLRCLTGRDEVDFLEGRQGLPIEDSVELAVRSCLDLAGIARPQPAEVESLTPGDLNRLLVAIHRLNFGPVVDAVASCPASGCDQELEIDLDLDSMLEAELPQAIEAEKRVELNINDKTCRLDLALPRVRDLKLAARYARGGGVDAERVLMERAIVNITRQDGRRAIGRKRALNCPEVRRSIETWLLAHDPFAHLGIRGSCPGCGTEARLIFDPAAFLSTQLQRHRQILDEVDLIASHYHWSEAEILDLPITRRQAYLTRIESRLNELQGRRFFSFGRESAA